MGNSTQTFWHPPSQPEGSTTVLWRYWLWSSLVFRLPDVHENRRGAWDLISQDKRWHNVIKERRSTTINFESIRQLKFIKHRSLRPSRILLHLVKGFGTISSIQVELVHLEVCSPTLNYHNPPPFLPLYIYGVTFVTWEWIPGSSYLVYIEKIGDPRDEASYGLGWGWMFKTRFLLCIFSRSHDITRAATDILVIWISVSVSSIWIIFPHVADTTLWNMD